MKRSTRTAPPPATTTPTRVAIYTRKSTDEGLDQDFNSLDAQREACEAYVLAHRGEGWIALPDRFDDGGWALALGSSTNYAPVGGTIRNAAFVNGLAGAAPTDPWNYVVGVIVCITVGSRELGTSLQANNATATRCPRTTAEAAAGAPVTEASADGRVRRTFIEMFTIRSQATGAPSIAL